MNRLDEAFGPNRCIGHALPVKKIHILWGWELPGRQQDTY